MRKVLVYFGIELKRGIQILCTSFVSLLVITLFLFAAVVGIHTFVQDSQSFSLLEIGVSVPDNEEQTAGVTRLIASMESIKSISHFSYLPEKEALEQLKEGKLQAVLSFPEHFYEGVYIGENPPAVLCVPKDSSLFTTVFEELATSGVSLLRTGEAGVYAAYDAAGIYSLKVQPEELGNRLAAVYAEVLLNRTRLFQVTVKSPWGDRSLLEYETGVAFTLLLLFCGINFGALYQKKNKSLEQKLTMYGISYGVQTGSKIAVMTILLWIIGGAGVLILRLLFSGFPDFARSLPEYRVFQMLPCCFSIASFFHMIYTLNKKNAQGAVVLFLVNLLMILCAGVAVPAAYLPAGMEKLGAFLPLGYWISYSSEMLFFAIGIKNVLTAAGIGILEIGIGEILSWKRE